MDSNDLPLLPVSLRRIGTAMLLVGAGGVVVAALWQGREAAGSVVAGATVAWLNVVGFAWTSRGMLRSGSVGWGLVATAKMFLLFGVVAWLVGHQFVRVIPFVMGYASLPAGAVVAQWGATPDHEDP